MTLLLTFWLSFAHAGRGCGRVIVAATRTDAARIAREFTGASDVSIEAIFVDAAKHPLALATSATAPPVLVDVETGRAVSGVAWSAATGDETLDRVARAILTETGSFDVPLFLIQKRLSRTHPAWHVVVRPPGQPASLFEVQLRPDGSSRVTEPIRARR